MTDQSTTDKRTWQCDIAEVEALLYSSASSGLSDTDAAERLARFGPNQLREKKGRSPIGQFLDQFKDFIIWVLIGAAVVSGFLARVGRRRRHHRHRHPQRHPGLHPGVPGREVPGRPQEALLAVVQGHPRRGLQGRALERPGPRRPRRARSGRQRPRRRPRRLAHLQLLGPGSQPDGRIDAGRQDRRPLSTSGRSPWRTGPTWSTWARRSPRARPGPS